VQASYSIASEVDLLLGHWHSRMALFSYYSFSQMLTIGYSDITPNARARHDPEPAQRDVRHVRCRHRRVDVCRHGAS